MNRSSAARYPAETVETIFGLYDRGEIQLTRSPDKTLLFQTGELSDTQIQDIVADIAAKVDKRLADFDAFVELIEKSADPSDALRSRFGSP